MNQSLILRGGTVVTGSGLQTADIAIKNGKIQCVLPDYRLLSKQKVDSNNLPEIIDISSFFVLPGFISLHPGNRIAQSADKMNGQIQSFLARGITSFVDILPLHIWEGKDRLAYLLNPFQSSEMDYAVRIQLPVEKFTYAHVRILRSLGHRWIDVMVHSKEQLNEIEWDKLYPLLAQHHIFLSLVIPGDGNLSQSEREQIKYEWYELCRYGNIRSLVQGKRKHRLNDDYYLIQQLSPTEIPEHLSAIRENNWLALEPIVASFEDWVEPIATKGWTGEDLLAVLVRLASANVAKTVGLFPYKGCLAPGADADLVLLEKSEWLTNFDRSTMLKISEICLPTYVMTKGQWQYVFGKQVLQSTNGEYLQQLKPYNYTI
ncbi:hypothetical protein [Brevibacillus sp. SYSU BS000544]|uniref:hypothetical protein n=1 Tax=Brevibacillus sp. SYSU BS000544 TaxID=3416443 RepID=UPI003CE543E0